MKDLDRTFDKSKFPEKMRELGYNVLEHDEISETYFRLFYALACRIKELECQLKQ